MKIVRWMSMMTMAAAMLLAGCSESINDGEGTDDGGLGNSGNGSGNGGNGGGNSGLVIEDSLNKETSIVGVWYQESVYYKDIYWIFRPNGTCTREYKNEGAYGTTTDEDSGIYKFDGEKLVTSVTADGNSAFVFNVQLMAATQLVLEDAKDNTSVVFKRVTVDDEPVENILGYWLGGKYYGRSGISYGMIFDTAAEDYDVDLANRVVKVKNKNTGELTDEYYIGYLSNKFLELYSNERSYLYVRNEEYDVNYEYPSVVFVESNISETKGNNSYIYTVSVSYDRTGWENLSKATSYVNGKGATIGSSGRERITVSTTVTTSSSQSSFNVILRGYIKGCDNDNGYIVLDQRTVKK